MTPPGGAQTDVIVVGGGLAGLTAALEVLDRGGRVLIVEKEAKLGGNSAKASSGINACHSDEIEAFVQDTLVSAGGKGDAKKIQILVQQSASALDWLQDRVGVDLWQAQTQLGGHSRARTHRPLQGVVGFSVMSALQKALKKYQENGQLQIHTSTSVTELVTTATATQAERVTGVVVQKESTSDPITWTASSVILATGGFAADRRPNVSFLAQFRPDLLDYPATCGDFSTGDGIVVGTSAGAATRLMDQVQIHPTGFVDPAYPNNGTKFLCAELLRGLGGILVDGSTGQRFCNELGTRDYVVDCMLQIGRPRMFLVLSEAAASQGGEHLKFYVWKKLLQKCEGLEALSLHTGISQETWKQTLQTYQQAAASGRDDHGKTNFPGMFQNEGEVYHVGEITPVLHYCMGGLAVNCEGQVLGSTDSVIPGLYAAGEVTGGLHGQNRLAGNSLLECLVFGRIIGQQIPIASKL